MLGRLQAFLVLGGSVVAMPAAAQKPTNEATAEDRQSADAGAEPVAAEEPTAEEPTAEEPAAEEPAAQEPPAAPTREDRQSAQAGTRLAAAGELNTEEPANESASEERESPQAFGEPPGPASDTRLKLSGGHRDWQLGVTGYFRAPFAIGISKRPGPDDPNGPAQTQLSYGPNRTVDANYYSFAYTRLQEQDWAELAIYAKKKHVEAAVGWMGYWYQTVGFRNPDAGWFPGIARLTLDTDFDVGGLKPNIALTGGAWWPRFGYFEKYDTYTLGLFRHIGEQVRLAIPFTSDFTLTLYQGFGTGRNGAYNYQIGGAPPIYGAKTGMDLLHYEHLRLTYKELVDVGLHFSNQWTRDPNLWQSTIEAKSFSDAAQAHLTVIGGEVDLRAAPAGHLWMSPSYIHVRNGWALAENGTEVMHALGGAGIATNYMAWSNSPNDSTGSGSMLNLGAMYQNSLSGIQGRPRGTVLPDVTLSVFGLMASAKLDLPEGSQVTQDRIKQLKYGADVEVQALTWLAVMLRYDQVNYDLDNPGYVFSAISPRVTFSSHFLSTESIYLQYSRYRYGDRMVLAGQWPWGVPLVAGSDIIQGGTYSGWKPDMDVIRLQASVAF